MRCFIVAGFLLTSASRGPSAIAEPLVIQYRSVTNTHTHTHTHTHTQMDRHTTTAYTALSKASRGKKWSFRCGDIAIFWIIKMAAVCHLRFLKCLNIIGYHGLGGQDVSRCQISSKVVNPLLRYWCFSIFQNCSHPPSWFFGANLAHPRIILGGLYQCAQFGNDWCSSFENTKVSIF